MKKCAAEDGDVAAGPEVRRFGLALALGLALSFAAPGLLAAQSTALDDLNNPFGDFTTFHLENGLKVWYRELSGSGVATVALAVPYGWDVDPRGHEGTAHLLEHVLFADRAGRTEAELRREIEDRGGTYNGHTTSSRTVYHATIASAIHDVAVQWLYDVIAPRTFNDSIIDRSRTPVAIETGVRRSVLGRAGALFISHPWLRPPGFWAREFGIETSFERDVDPWTALHATGADELSEFYSRYYVPSRMTLFIVGSTPLDSMRPLLDRTFGSLPARPEPPADPVPVLRDVPTARYFWAVTSNTDLGLRYRIADMTGRDRLHLLFMEELLQRRLFERLRLGSTPMAYGVNVGTVQRGRAAYFEISVRVRATHEDAARSIIAEEIARLQNAAADTAFLTDRDAVSRQLLLDSGNPTALHSWLFFRLGTTELHDTFPDAGRYFVNADPDTIARHARRLIRADTEMLTIIRPYPIPLPAIAVIGMLCAMIGARLYRWRACDTADMSRVRFIGRLHPPSLLRLVAGLATLLLAVVALRLLVSVAHFAADRWFFSIDSFAIQYGAIGALTTFVTFVAFSLVGAAPRKILVFEDEIRLKSMTYGARRIPAELVRSVCAATGRDARRRVRRLLGHRFGTRRPGVLIELAGNRGWLLYVRDPAGLVRSIQQMAPWTRTESGAGTLPRVEVTDEVVDADDLSASVVIAGEYDAGPTLHSDGTP